MSLNLWVIPVNIRRAQSVGNGDSLEAKSKAWGIFTKSLSIITEYLIYFKTVDGTSDLMIAGSLAEFGRPKAEYQFNGINNYSHI